MNLSSRVLYIPRPARITAAIQSRFRMPDIAYETVCEILLAYGLRLTARPKNLPNARRNRNLIVQTSGGKKVIKLYRQDWQVSTILFEHSILNRLVELGFQAPRPLQATNGASYLGKAHNIYAVFDFIEGTNYSTSFLFRSHRYQLMEAAGQALASLHRLLRGYLPEGRHHLGFESYAGDRHRDMAWHARKIEELETKSHDLPDPQDSFLAGRLIQQRPFITGELERLDENLGRAPLVRLIIHGDYGIHNLLYQKSGRAVPVDYELARLEWRLSDLVSCLSKLSFGSGPYDFESQRHFLRGYQREYPIGDEEWQLFPAVWRFYRLMGAVQYWNSYFETNGPRRKLISALEALDQAEWARSHPQKILELNS